MAKQYENYSPACGKIESGEAGIIYTLFSKNLKKVIISTIPEA